MSSDAEQKIEAYLTRLSLGLRGLSRDDINEIVEELRGHILERATLDGEVSAAGVQAALANLGNPERLAHEYVTDNLLARAEVSGSPWQILHRLFRWASFSFAGFFVLLGAVSGYLLGCTLMSCAVFKTIHPHTAGLWVYGRSASDLTFSLRMGFGGPLPGARELLGWWIVPIGLLVGCGLVTGTTRFTLSCARHYCKSQLSTARPSSNGLTN